MISCKKHQSFAMHAIHYKYDRDDPFQMNSDEIIYFPLGNEILSRWLTHRTVYFHFVIF